MLASRLGMASCPETAHSAWLDLVSGSWDGDQPLSHPKLGIGHLSALSWEGLIWVVARLPLCDPPSQLGKGCKASLSMKTSSLGTEGGG